MRTLIAVALALLPVVTTAGTTVTFVGGRSHETWHGQADMQALDVEFGRALSPRTEVALVLSPTHFWQPRSWFGDQFGDGNESVNAIAGSVLVRRRFNVDSSRIAYFVEGATGPMWAEKAIPASTSRFNFVSHGAIGVVLMPHARFPLMAGYRFSHVSNGGYSPRNPGMNFSSIVVGVGVRRPSRRY
jgi:hypothetical protein